MVFHHLHDFLAMGGYAAYVWSAYGITLFSISVFSGYWLRRLYRQMSSS